MNYLSLDNAIRQMYHPDQKMLDTYERWKRTPPANYSNNYSS